MANGFLCKLGEKFGTKNPEKEVKCILVGDNNVGKTKLICSYIFDQPVCDVTALNSATHSPTVFAYGYVDHIGKISQRHRIGKHAVNLLVWDTFGDHHKDREYSYQNANVVLLCFSLGCFKSLENVVSHWYPELKKYCPRVPIILVGTQADRRHNDPKKYYRNKKKIKTLKEYLQTQDNDTSFLAESINCIESEVVRGVARDIGALLYFETSVATKFGVETLFTTATKVGFSHKMKAKKSEFLSIKIEMFQPPYLKEQTKSPVVKMPIRNKEVLFSSFFEPIEKSFLHDVTFHFSDIDVYAHSTVLVFSVNFFENLFKELANYLDSENFKDFDRSTDCDCRNEDSCDCIGDVEKYDYIQLNQQTYADFSTIYVISYYNGNSTKRCYRRLYVFLMDNVKSVDLLKVLEFYYKGIIDSQIPDVSELYALAKKCQMKGLENYVSNIMENKDLLNLILREKLCSKVLNSCHKFMKFPLHSDIVFKLSGGSVVEAHKLILAQKCEFMKVMFQHEMFTESTKLQIDFPDTNVESFHSMLEYLYTGQCEKITDLHGTLQLANFLCLKQLVAICEERIRCHVLEMKENDDKDLYSFVIDSYNLGEFHNAPQLSAWCKHFMATNYNDLCRDQGKELKTLLDEGTIKYLEDNRWPPVWYLKEQDYYERTMRQLRLEQEQGKEKKKKRVCLGCF